MGNEAWIMGKSDIDNGKLARTLEKTDMDNGKD
jgi:hypothetical protein